MLKCQTTQSHSVLPVIDEAIQNGQLQTYFKNGIFE